MTTINILDFEHFDHRAIYEFILLQHEKEFKIILPKENFKPQCDNFDIVWEYHIAAFIGQQLFQIAEAFSYYTPSIYKKQPFSFDIEIKDPEKLADVLHFIITGLYENDVEVTIHFHEGATRLFTEAFEKEELDVACFGLLEIANRHCD